MYRNPLICFLVLCSGFTKGQSLPSAQVTTPEKSINYCVSTFLGNFERNYYGNEAPDSLHLIWKTFLGSGKTVISRKLGTQIWAGAGWTGQPLVVSEDSTIFLVQGAYDHNLKRIHAGTGKVVWQYTFDDVIKGTGTLWENPFAKDLRERHILFQGSRLGVGNYLDSPHIPSFRAISYSTGEELWRLDVKWTDSYSRDADGSALIYNNLLYAGLENSLLTIINPLPDSTRIIDSMRQPKIVREHKLYRASDMAKHKGNLVTESSPCILRNHIYISSGSGHVWGYNLLTDSIDWEFFTGSDMDGSPVVTSDSCLLVTLEKQYIDGPGGVFKLDVSKPADSAVIWFFPTQDIIYADWLGGIIGSCAINDQYVDSAGQKYAAFHAIDGYLYIVNHQKIRTDIRVIGPDNKTLYPTPVEVDRFKCGPSISTPVFGKDCVIATGYNGITLFKRKDSSLKFEKTAYFEAEFEATPVYWNRRLYVASRNGYLYCLGD